MADSPATSEPNAKQGYTIHVNVGRELADRLAKLAYRERRTKHNLAVKLLEDGITLLESQSQSPEDR